MPAPTFLPLPPDGLHIPFRRRPVGYSFINVAGDSKADHLCAVWLDPALASFLHGPFSAVEFEFVGTKHRARMDLPWSGKSAGFNVPGDFDARKYEVRVTAIAPDGKRRVVFRGIYRGPRPTAPRAPEPATSPATLPGPPFIVGPAGTEDERYEVPTVWPARLNLDAEQLRETWNVDAVELVVMEDDAVFAHMTINLVKAQSTQEANGRSIWYLYPKLPMRHGARYYLAVRAADGRELWKSELPFSGK